MKAIKKKISEVVYDITNALEIVQLKAIKYMDGNTGYMYHGFQIDFISGLKIKLVEMDKGIEVFAHTSVKPDSTPRIANEVQVLNDIFWMTGVAVNLQLASN